MPSGSKDNWLRNYEALVELGARIGVKIRERDSGGYGKKASGSLGKLLTEYQQKLRSLKGSLHTLSTNYSISDSEYTQRKEMIEELDRKYEQLSRSQKTGWSSETPYGSTGEGWSGGAGPGSAQRLSLDEIRHEQQQMISEQDKGLENLSRALRRQAEVGLAMQDEIVEHNVLIDEIHEATTKTDDKIRFHTRRVEETRRKESCKCTCALVTVIIVLLLVIIIIAAVPFGGKA